MSTEKPTTNILPHRTRQSRLANSDMRLNQFLARNLGISRRQGDQLIVQHKVKVNGHCGQLFTRVEDTDVVEIEKQGTWSQINVVKQVQTILFYKPIFCLTTRFDPIGRKTIYHHLPPAYHHLKPAGRLDYMSEGLLVLSNDGRLLQSLTHPRFHSRKVYLVSVHEPFATAEIQQMQQGIRLDGYNLNPVEVWQDPVALTEWSYLKLANSTNWYFFQLTEGRNQQIRKLCNLFGKRVSRLIRLQQGSYQVSAQLYQQKILHV